MLSFHKGLYSVGFISIAILYPTRFKIIQAMRIKMLGTFQKAFSQAATSQGFFPSGNFPRVFSKWQLPKCAISQKNLPKSALAAVLGLIVHPSGSTRPLLY